MHIVDGALTLPVVIAGTALALAGTAKGLKELELNRIPQVGLLSAAFFLASSIHVPIGPSSVHLILNGLMGLVLGWAAFPAILAGLLLEAVFFGFGGVVVEGVNLANTALPAVMVHLLMGRRLTKVSRGKLLFINGFIAGFLAIVLTTGMVALCLALSGDEFSSAAQLVFFAHAPVAILEGFITGAAVVLIAKVKPDLLHIPERLAGHFFVDAKIDGQTVYSEPEPHSASRATREMP